MTDLEIFLDYAKQCHDAKDAAEIMDIIHDMQQLDFLYQQGNPYAVAQFVGTVVKKHQAEANEHDHGRPQAQDIYQLYLSCRGFLVGLGKDKIAKKAAEKLAEEALKRLGGN